MYVMNSFDPYLKKPGKTAYVSILVEIVVGQFRFVKGERLFHPVSSRGWRVRMDVESFWHVWFRLSSGHPFGVVVLVATVIQWNNVHEEDVLGPRVQSIHGDLERRKHPSGYKWKFLIKCSFRHFSHGFHLELRLSHVDITLVISVKISRARWRIGRVNAF